MKPAEIQDLLALIRDAEAHGLKTSESKEEQRAFLLMMLIRRLELLPRFEVQADMVVAYNSLIESIHQSVTNIAKQL